MHVPLDDVFIVPHNGKFLLHAPLRGISALLSADAAAELTAFSHNGSLDVLSPITRSVAERVLDSIPGRPPIRTGSFSPQKVGMIPTNDCNMRCSYCCVQAGRADVSHMAVDVAEAALDHQAGVVERCGYKDLSVSYFGGEPFLAFDLIKHCDAYGRRLADGLGVEFHAVANTNGYMPPIHAHWVAQHFSSLLITLEGLPALHDARRANLAGGGTYRNIAENLRIFDAEGLSYGLRCNIDENMAGYMPEIACHFCTQFQPSVINFEPLGRIGKDGRRVLAPSAAEFVNGFVAAGKVARAHGIPVKFTRAEPKRLTQISCSAGDDHYVVTPDGLVTACYCANSKDSFNADSQALGRFEADKGALMIDEARLQFVRSCSLERLASCRSCFCKWHCAGGCRLQHVAGVRIAEHQDDICAVTQKLMLWQLFNHIHLYEEADSVRLDDIAGIAMAG